MRKMNKGKKLPAMLIALAILLCSFPAVFAEEVTIPAEEAAVEVQQIPAEAEPEVIGIPEEAPAAEPEVVEIPEEEPATEPEVEEIPEEEPAAEPEVAEISEEEPESELEVEEIPEEEPETEPEVAEIPEEEPAEAPEDEWNDEPEAESVREDESEDLIEIEDDDAGSVSEERLAEFNNPETYEAAGFSGSVEIEMKSSEIRCGGDVTLAAKVSGVDMNHRLVWEGNDGDGRGWFTVGSGPEYTFTLTRDIVNREYRVSLYTVD